jgi:glycosyltransferase involved in cell wall biosynthesis/CDP-glycerol glycerophosphotransferase (TagB/SpsB family)
MTPRNVAVGPDAVALVIPIYNVEEYLDECLQSVAAQTIFDDMQVVLVDDGSTDSSGEIAATFAARHQNVTLVTQENGGLGAARNRGMREVTAPFVTFLDSDDRLPERAVETLRAVLLEHDADVAIGAMMTFPRPTSWVWLRHLDETSKVVPGVEHAEELIHGASVCNKLFRTARLRAMELSFGERTHFEDVFVSLPILLTADRIALTSEVVYHYRQRAAGDSIMNSIWSRTQNFWDHLAVEEFLDRLRPSVEGARKHVLDLFKVRSFQGFALRAPESLAPGELVRFFDRCVAVYGDISPDVVQRGALDARHRVAFAAFMLRDRHLFEERTSAIRGLDAVEGRLQLRLATPTPDMLQALLTADRAVAHLESVQPAHGGRTLTVRGRLTIDGMPLGEPVPVDLAVRVRGSGLTHPATNERRHVASAGVVTDNWGGFVCELPARRLKTGDHHLRLVFITPSGQASVHLRPANGALRAARTVPVSSGRVLLLKQHGTSVLRVQAGHGAAARRRWRRRLLLDDLRHITSFRTMWHLRLARLLTAPLVRGPVWVLGERRDTAQDNSFALFRFLRRNRTDVRAYYVIDRSSAQYRAIRGLGRVVRHSSWKHRLLMLHARVLVNSYDIDAYVTPDGWPAGQFLEHLAWRVGSRRVFLQHGVTYNNVSAALHRGVTGLDLFVTTSQREAAAVRSGMGYTSEVAVTGFPRFDSLAQEPVGDRILVMPTWRTQLVRPSYAKDREAVADFDDSAFAAFWRGLLHDGQLLDLLARTGTTIEFFGHYEMADAVRRLVPDHPNVVVSDHHGRSVQQAILDCSLFVTDWSSTFFDAAYAGRPVVLAPFDEEEFRATQYAQGYFDLEADGFGPVVRTVEDAVAAVVGYISRGYVREPLFESRLRSFFVHRDTDNCPRVVEAIERVIDGRPLSDGVRVPEGSPVVDELTLAS